MHGDSTWIAAAQVPQYTVDLNATSTKVWYPSHLILLSRWGSVSYGASIGITGSQSHTHREHVLNYTNVGIVKCHKRVCNGCSEQQFMSTCNDFYFYANLSKASGPVQSIRVSRWNLHANSELVSHYNANCDQCPHMHGCGKLTGTGTVLEMFGN